jgi:hypothetical protein
VTTLLASRLDGEGAKTGTSKKENLYKFAAKCLLSFRKMSVVTEALYAFLAE